MIPIFMAKKPQSLLGFLLWCIWLTHFIDAETDYEHHRDWNGEV
jgi:hypothetical protein